MGLLLEVSCGRVDGLIHLVADGLVEVALEGATQLVLEHGVASVELLLDGVLEKKEDNYFSSKCHSFTYQQCGVPLLGQVRVPLVVLPRLLQALDLFAEIL